MSKAFVHTVLKQYAEQNMPADLDLLPAIRRRILAAPRRAGTPPVPRSRSWVHQSPVRMISTGMVVLVLLGLSTVALVHQPTPVSAAEVLARAEQAMGNTTTSALQNLHGVYQIRYRNDPLGAFSAVREEMWFQAPNRSVGTWLTRFPDGHQSRQWAASDNSTDYAYDQDSQEFLLRQPTDPMRPLGATNLNQVLEIARRATIADPHDPLAPQPTHVYDAQLVGTAIVMGRPAYVISMTFVPGSSIQASDLQVPTHLKWWIDQQVFLVLQEEGSDSAGHLMQSGTSESLQINSPIDPTVFNFAPPVGAAILDLRPIAADDVTTAWGALANRVSSPLFTLAQPPVGLIAGRPTYDSVRGITTQTYYDARFASGAPSVSASGSYSRQVVAPRLVVIQGLPAAICTAGLGIGRSLNLNGLTGQLYKQNDTSSLIVDREGTRIWLRLEAGSGRRDSDLITAATSLQGASSAGH